MPQDFIPPPKPSVKPPGSVYPVHRRTSATMDRTSILRTSSRIPKKEHLVHNRRPNFPRNHTHAPHSGTTGQLTLILTSRSRSYVPTFVPFRFIVFTTLKMSSIQANIIHGTDHSSHGHNDGIAPLSIEWRFPVDASPPFHACEVWAFSHSDYCGRPRTSLRFIPPKPKTIPTPRSPILVLTRFHLPPVPRICIIGK
ncbi:hypothetical protein BDN72DRAFT_440230 [Pluteus cervinus]|uniref:Uncharacterized protein n=1 Tax=Pluteus cervinus TaxID=181527 RepID=A0ACD3A6Y1_9AGAR|nr:hypothetical protein BDN72DRAFT_440230 [Pluteus cervinus]